MPTMVQRKCRCGDNFMARKADVKRGWGKFCSKSCKAIRQEQLTGRTAAYRSRQEGHGHGRAMSPAELALGGYGDADNNSPFGEGKY